MASSFNCHGNPNAYFPTAPFLINYAMQDLVDPVQSPTGYNTNPNTYDTWMRFYQFAICYGVKFKIIANVASTNDLRTAPMVVMQWGMDPYTPPSSNPEEMPNTICRRLNSAYLNNKSSTIIKKYVSLKSCLGINAVDPVEYSCTASTGPSISSQAYIAIYDDWAITNPPTVDFHVDCHVITTFYCKLYRRKMFAE